MGESKSLIVDSWRFCVAPMLDWTDVNCRFFHRLISRRARLYTEMVTTGALLHGDVKKLLYFNVQEHPVALQLGGSDPKDLAQCAKLGQDFGYDEINLNCGCPSERVQKGAFGACLMKTPHLVADCVRAMQDTVEIPVTVKHRIGVDEYDSYDFVRDFVGTLFEAGTRVFIVHTRKAWLKGLSPEENRKVPPLKREVAYKLKKDFPEAVIVVNGGISSMDEAAEVLKNADGVMVGRAAYKNPWMLSLVDSCLYGEESPVTKAGVLQALAQYASERRELPALKSCARAAMGLMSGEPGARHFRRVLSESKNFSVLGPGIFNEALKSMSDD